MIEIEEKIHTQKDLTRLLMKIMAEKNGSDAPPHPKSKDPFIVRRYYLGIVQHAARRALEEKQVYPIKNKGGKPYLYTAAELEIIVGYIEKEMNDGEEASGWFAKIGFGMDEIDLLRHHFKSLRSSQ